MLNVHITALTDEELDAVAAGQLIVRDYQAVGAGASIDSNIKAGSATALGITVETLLETTKIVSAVPAAKV